MICFKCTQWISLVAVILTICHSTVGDSSHRENERSHRGGRGRRPIRGHSNPATGQGHGSVSDQSRADEQAPPPRSDQPISAAYNHRGSINRCGDTLSGDSGVIESPDFGSGSYPNSIVCDWRIRVPSGAGIRLHFAAFGVQQCSRCGCDRLLIYSRRSASEPSARLCGGQIPDDFVTDNNNVRIRFITNGAASGPGFRIMWSKLHSTQVPTTTPSQQISCGGSFTTNAGEFRSPMTGNAGLYPDRTTCEWRIRVSHGVAQLRFSSFAVESCAHTCPCDRVEVYYSHASTVPNQVLCGDERPETITSMSSEMKIRFRSDDSIMMQGFMASWSAVEEMPTNPGPPPMSCGGDLMGMSGTIHTPNYGSGPYPPSADCAWHVQIPDGKKLNLHFTTFRLEYCYLCGCDKLEVFNQMESMIPRYRFCGSRIPQDITVESESAKIRFASDVDTQSQGAEIQWSLVDDDQDSGPNPTHPPRPQPNPPRPQPNPPRPQPNPPSECKYNLTAPSGTIESPNYGRNEVYADSLDCEWIIYAERSKVVKFTFNTFAVEMCSHCSCDRLKIFDLQAHEDREYCGSHVPGVYVTKGPYVVVKFTTDSSVEALGFQMNYEIIDPNNMPPEPMPPVMPPLTNATCGQPAIEPVQTRVIGGEPAKPNSWPWQVSIRSTRTGRHTCGGSIIAAQWILTAAHCVSDTQPSDIKVVAGDHDLRQRSSVEEELIVREIHNHQNYDEVELENDIALLKLSAPIQFRAEVSPACLSDIPVTDGFLCTLSGWGDTNGPQDRTILQQVQLETIPHDVCRRSDWNGNSITQDMLCAGVQQGGRGPCHGDSGGPLVCKIHETWRLHGVVSWGYECGGVQQPGVFTRVSRYLTWINRIMEGVDVPEVGQNECTSIFEPIPVTGNITSPGFTMSQPYPNNARCAWRLQAPAGQAVTLHFESFDVEQDHGCAYDALKIYNGRDMNAPVLKNLCGSRKPSDVSGTDSEMYITFTSDDSVTGRGFEISYRTGAPEEVKPEVAVVIPEANPVAHTGQCGNTPMDPILPETLRIVGGITARPYTWPWQVSVQNIGYHFCGGTVIDKRWVVTASHCLASSDPTGIQVVIREHDISEADERMTAIDVEEIVDHQDYNFPVPVNNDIALLKLSRDIVFDDYAQPACIPQAPAPEGLVCVTTGWGSTNGSANENILNQVDVPVLNSELCNRRDWYRGMISEQMMCAGYPEGNKDSCQGDSGGPLVCRVNGVWYLHGITSWGFGCGLPRRPGIYTRITEFTDWIAFYTNGDVRPTY